MRFAESIIKTRITYKITWFANDTVNELIKLAVAYKVTIEAPVMRGKSIEE